MSISSKESSLNNISVFSRFAKVSDVKKLPASAKTAVVYTRVSSKEQADTNLSLDFQKKTIEEYASRNGFSIVEYFGGTYESAKSDGRKEFQRMLAFIKKNKGKVSHILVYTLDRFSRTGGGAIKLSEDLREKYGVTIDAVTQPADTTNASGVLQQNIHFIFSKYDNELRKQRATAGTKEKFEKGIWAAKPPLGYDILKTGGERKIIINATGKKLKKAFVWKSQGWKNEAILEKLRALGINLRKQHLTKILANPFYCGLISHKMLEGRVIQGTQEPLITPELFLKVNEIHRAAPGYGVPHRKELEEVPLKVFVRCSECNIPFTGYIVKAKNLWYYKCRTKGCKCNKSAIKMHDSFKDLLGEYSIQEHLIAPLKQETTAAYRELCKETVELAAALRAQLDEVQSKIETIEEKYFIAGEMSRETYEKFCSRYKSEEASITKELDKLTKGSSNPMETISKAVSLAANLATTWASSDVLEKERLQNLLFPEGITYDRKMGQVRTERVNEVFSLIASLARVLGQKERGQASSKNRLSPCVRKRRFCTCSKSIVPDSLYQCFNNSAD